MRCMRVRFAELIALITLSTLVTWTMVPPRARAQSALLSGTFHVAWGDPLPGSRLPGTAKYLLIDDRGEWNELRLAPTLLEPLGGRLAVNGKRVTVTGRAAIAPSTRRAPLLEVDAIELEPAMADAVVAAAAVSGSRRWVTILCRFADSTTVTPHPRDWYEGLMGLARPGMDHYWREVSYNAVNLTGSRVVGWYNLPHARSHYVHDTDGDGDPDLEFHEALEDCAGAASGDISLPDFDGINLIFNQLLDCCAWGGSGTLPWTHIHYIFGFPFPHTHYKTYGVTWLPPWAQNAEVVAHEMGHAFGLPHSSGPYANAYDSQWDPMSAGGTCSAPDAIYGCVPVHTISYHKNRLGWIPDSQKYVAAPGTTTTIALQPLAQSSSSLVHLMAEIPIGGSTTEFYTVEARLFRGYDGQIPGEAIVIHGVNTTLGDRLAQVVDIDGNWDPNDDGAMWVVTEEFVDWDNRIAVSVVTGLDAGFIVTIANDPADLVVSGLSVPVAAAPGQLVSITDTTRNNGGGSAGSTTTRLYFSTNSFLDGTDLLLGSRAVATLAPSVTSSGSTSITIPAGTAYGNYYLIARADADAAVFEFQENNNTRAMPIAITPSVDLSATMIDSPDPAFVGEPLTYTVRVTNRGPGTATGVTLIDDLPWNVTFLSATPSQGVCSHAARRVSCTLGTLANGAKATVETAVVPVAPPKVFVNPWKITNSSSVTGDQADPNTTNNRAVAVTTVYDF